MEWCALWRRNRLGGAEVERVRADLATDFQAGQAKLENRLAEKPGKGFIVGTALSIVVGGITLIAATIAGMPYLQGAT